jgi:UDP-N-acetylglucosamine 1-carboxyvinyltransferase
MGVKTQRKGPGSFRFQADDVNLDYFKTEEFRQKGGALRGSTMILGPLVSALRNCSLAKAGRVIRSGDDAWILTSSDLSHLGATFHYDSKSAFFEARAENGLKGTYMLLDEASVTGTANIVMAACLAEGKTTIYNAACEPYLQQLCKMINRMGGKITGIGSNLLQIEGVEALGGTEHRCLPDMIEIGSFIGLAAMTKSEITIKDVAYDELGVIPRMFRKLGIQLERRGDDLFVPAQDSYAIQTFIDGSILTVSDAPWPGFTPDLLSIVLVTATQARGSVLVHQKMFESRLFFTDKLIDMGAQIILCDPHRATVIGMDRQSPLRGVTMTSRRTFAPVSHSSSLRCPQKVNRSSTTSVKSTAAIRTLKGRLKALGARIERVD